MNTRFCPICRLNFGDLNFCPRDGSPLAALPTEYPPANTVVDGRYVMYAPMAAGGMSRVYRASDKATSTPLAVKILDPRLAVHPYTVERFYRDARVCRLLEHPNVVRVYAFGPTREGHHAICMELLGGESLRDLLNRETTLPWERAVHIILELCDALGHSHGRGVIHRDIKPDNMQLTGSVGPDERVKLIDFGIAHIMPKSAHPGPIQVSGTPAYMSPEQIRGIGVTGQSDLYSIGCVLYEMLCGTPPFTGDDPILVCKQQLKERPPDLSGRLAPDADVPGQLLTMIKQLISKSPNSRVPGVGALLGQLMGLLPKDRWPTRLKLAHRGSGPKPRITPLGRLKHPTTELLNIASNAPVTVLQVEVKSRRRKKTSIMKWPDELNQLVAGWRAIVEDSGGLVEQPRPATLRATFGVFQVGEPADVGDVIGHALRLRELIARYDGGLGLYVRSCIIGATITDGEVAHALGEAISSDSSALADELIRNAPESAVVVDEIIRQKVGSSVPTELLGTLNMPGYAEPVSSYLLRVPLERS